ncbi:hypothetical protein NNJEOMEG_03053 [Fundidesulfovibrio magnetotacticus]|uniref:Uncharacterized protein n=1 Tax=Fundidesulfovibrio magnetotacticus TaxID=2730080 RepID=A0A6V8M460_9BACT|nr:hypothetical protein NNJEOMEG_03053 [Fundidesulfovibrio magnetotacticus]
MLLERHKPPAGYVPAGGFVLFAVAYWGRASPRRVMRPSGRAGRGEWLAT